MVEGQIMKIYEKYLNEGNQIIHVYKDYNKTYKIEDNKDNVLEDEFKTPDAAYDYAVKHYPKATIYRFKS